MKMQKIQWQADDGQLNEVIDLGVLRIEVYPSMDGMSFNRWKFESLPSGVRWIASIEALEDGLAETLDLPLAEHETREDAKAYAVTEARTLLTAALERLPE